MSWHVVGQDLRRLQTELEFSVAFQQPVLSLGLLVSLLSHWSSRCSHNHSLVCFADGPEISCSNLFDQWQPQLARNCRTQDGEQYGSSRNAALRVHLSW